MNCNTFGRKMRGFINGELSASEASQCAQHADSCAGCGKLLSRETRAEDELRAVIRKKKDVSGGNVSEIMNIIDGMPAPSVRIQERSILFKACFTLYNAFVIGIMCAVAYMFVCSGFFSLEQVMFLPEARSALFGAVCIFTGCLFVLIKGRDMNNWLAARMLRHGAVFQLSADALFLVTAGAGFCMYGSILFASSIF